MRKDIFYYTIIFTIKKENLKFLLLKYSIIFKFYKKSINKNQNKMDYYYNHKQEN